MKANEMTMTIREYWNNNLDNLEDGLAYIDLDEEMNKLCEATGCDYIRIEAYDEDDENNNLFIIEGNEGYNSKSYVGDEWLMWEVINVFKEKMGKDINNALTFIKGTLERGEDEITVWRNDDYEGYQMFLYYGEDYGLQVNEYFDPYKGAYIVVTLPQENKE